MLSPSRSIRCSARLSICLAATAVVVGVGAGQFGASGIGGSGFGASLLQGQEPKAADPVKEGKGTDEPEALTTLKQVDGEIRELMSTLTGLREEFGKADDDSRREEIQAKAMTIQAKQPELLERLAAAFGPAFRASPEDRLVKEILPSVVGLYLQTNRYADAREFGLQQLAGENPEPQVAEWTGLAHFADHDFAKAKEIIDGAGAGEPSLKNFKAEVESCTKLWAVEQEVRRKEGEADDLPRVVIKTSRGEITAELFENEAPETIGNFIALVEKKVYDGTSFHRVIPSFMAQGGDPNSKDDDEDNDGQGGPGYTIPCECYAENARMHFAGSLSMAHAGKDTGGSQFFITHLPTTHLNGKHTVFGRVLSGLDVPRSLRQGDRIQEIVVLRKRDHEYAVPASAKMNAPESESESESESEEPPASGDAKE